MTPGLEPLASAPDAVPSLLGAGLRIAGVLALLGVGAWFLVKRRGFTRTARSLEVVDRAFLARGASVALLRVGPRRLLLGITAEHVRLLRDLGDEVEAAGGHGAGAPPARFAETLERVTSGPRSGV